MSKWYEVLPGDQGIHRPADDVLRGLCAQRRRINLSPKGMDTFRILGDTRVIYLDITGSGNETASHLFENGRITIMFCSFDRARTSRAFTDMAVRFIRATRNGVSTSRCFRHSRLAPDNGNRHRLRDDLMRLRGPKLET